MKGKRKRLEALEEKRRAFEASHVRRSDVLDVLLTVLQIVGEEASQDTARRIEGRVVADAVARLTAGTA